MPTWSRPRGDWAAVYLAVRPGGFTPQFHVLGRETFLAGIDWVDGWPVFDEDRYRVPKSDTAFTDDFTAPGLDARWVAPGAEPESIARPHPDGGWNCTTLRTALRAFSARGSAT
ncbi:hypothetical protein GCM10029992_48010 [Glycomyces albus]